MSLFTPRSSQKEILAYTGGHLGISAVPGSGKTHTLSALAARLISSKVLARDQEVLIVTLVNSAVDNFETRIKQFFNTPLEAVFKYRVRTLHGLAHDIVREKPARVGLEERFQIVDDQEATRMRADAVHAWLQSNPDALLDYIDPDLDENKRDWTRREQLPGLLENLALAFIRSAKDHRLTPDRIRALLDRAPAPLPLAEMGLAMYTDYQRGLQYRGAVDFDDLIRFSVDLLENDPEYLERLRYRFPFILEDEAQDSSQLQEQILGLLSGPGGNWVRVGDPNQAIFETFTTASPELLRRFIDQNPSVDMPELGRSQISIINLANHLIEWVMTGHPLDEARTALNPPWIQPTAGDDPQRNPPNDPTAIRFIGNSFSPAEEVEAVANSVEKWLPGHLDATVAVLVPRNQRGVDVTDALKARGIELVELLGSTSNTRATAGSLNHLLSFLADPQSASKLAKCYQVWRRDWREQEANQAFLKRIPEILRKCGRVESFLAPSPGMDWLESISTQLAEEQPGIVPELEAFRQVARRWLEAVTLPIDQLVLTLGADVFSDPADLALAHKLALVLRQVADDHSEWRLPELAGELTSIAKNERRFIGFSSDDSGFDPERHKGKVVVTTMHKAKGLEWDRVYLVSVNNYDFPSGLPSDRYISEKWFLRDGLNLEAEALAQLKAVLSSGEYDWYTEGEATRAARDDYNRERLRLLFVGITRAKKDLIVTWNTGRQGDATPALGFVELQGWMEGYNSSPE